MVVKIKGTCGGQNERYLWPSLLFVGSDIKLFIELIW